jgi:hypothetical protein
VNRHPEISRKMPVSKHVNTRFPLPISRTIFAMLKNKLTHLARMSPALALLSCAAPKAEVVQEAPAPKQETAEKTTAAVSETSATSLPDDGIRLPDMLGLPGENEFRTTRPATGTASGAVIAKPPTEP